MRGDADMLKQAILNLVTNAFEAMKGGGRLRIAVENGGDFVNWWWRTTVRASRRNCGTKFFSCIYDQGKGIRNWTRDDLSRGSIAQWYCGFRDGDRSRHHFPAAISGGRAPACIAPRNDLVHGESSSVAATCLQRGRSRRVSAGPFTRRPHDAFRPASLSHRRVPGEAIPVDGASDGRDRAFLGLVHAPPCEGVRASAGASPAGLRPPGAASDTESARNRGSAARARNPVPGA